MLLPLELTEAASAADTVIYKIIVRSWTSKHFGLGTKMLRTSHKETKYIMKIVKSLKYSGVFIEGVTK